MLWGCSRTLCCQRTETLMLGQDQETGETGDEGLWSIDTESANASGVGAYDAKNNTVEPPAGGTATTVALL